MLQSSLIRAKIRKGKIYPVFADINNVRDVELASTMIDRFKSAVKNGETKGSIASSVKELEYYYDYRLVRGFYSLLERQSVFKSKADYHGIDPILLRRKVFEESSKRGFALTEYERGRIMSDIAKAFNINSNMLEELLMSDMDDNLLIIELKPISVDKLIASYNLSLIQTLLFKCVTFECKVSSGVEWKYLLRDVKRLGLMYMLEYDDNNNNNSSNKKVSNITCIVDGPLSIFKMTEKYGTSIARLIPTIVNAREWYIRAWIVRDSNRARSYEFTLSSKDNVMLDKSRDPSTNIYDYNGKSITIYDSSIEERFANTFINYDTGWRLVREPEPIVVSNKAFIPDFAFEKGNIRVYLEIVGFWTKEYIERKLQKIRELRVERSDIDIIVAIDKELECSKHSIVSSIASNNVNVIVYEGKHGIPITHIINYLKSIEEKMINAHATSNMLDEIASIINSSASIIDMHLIAERYNISLDTLLSTLNSIEYTTKYTRVGNRYLISNWLLDNIKNAMVDMKSNKFTDACSLLAEYGIPEECYATLLYLLGYDVVWNSININNAVIVKRSNNNN
jgi:predicted nuclease of restriction endonuclease-like RecB superfamily